MQAAADLGITLRPATTSDRDFLLKLFESTRAAELDAIGWDVEQRQQFLEMQFNAQTRGHSASYPHADSQIVVLDGDSIGRMLVDRGSEKFVLVDIALLPEHRRRGFGTFLIEELLDEAGKIAKRVELQVFRTGQAVRLYERLGFTVTGEDAMYLTMQWIP